MAPNILNFLSNLYVYIYGTIMTFLFVKDCLMAFMDSFVVLCSIVI